MIQSFDERRDIIIPGDAQATIAFSVGHFIEIAQKSLSEKGHFSVALSGGSTPKAIYQGLLKDPRIKEIDWQKVLFFFSDERSVPPDDPESNYHMAMEAGLKNLPISVKNIFRMQAASEIETHAKLYEQEILNHIAGKQFDLMMLGMGEDGHTASLFPKTHGLHATGKFAIANFVPSKNTWRMSLTFDCINESRNIAIYVIGKAKAATVKQVLEGPYEPDKYPVQRVGTTAHKALWVLDEEAASLMH